MTGLDTELSANKQKLLAIAARVEFLKWLTTEGGIILPRVVAIGRWAGVLPLMFTSAVVIGRIGDENRLRRPVVLSRSRVRMCSS